MTFIKRPAMKTKNRLRTAALLVASVSTLVAAMPADAQESETQALRRQIEELQARLDRIEAAQNAQVEAAKATPPATSKLPIAISGLLQVQALGFANQDGPATRAVDTFRLRRGELRATGTITPRLTGTIMIDPAKGLSTPTATSVFTPAAGGGPGGTVTTTVSQGASGNILQELQLSYLLRTQGLGATASNQYIDVGQFKIPVGYESLLSSSALPLVERAQIFAARDPFGGGYGDIRDTGVQLRGNFGPQFNYRVGIFNGFGERQNALALSSNKAYLGLLSFSPKGVPGLQLGISGGAGNTRTSGNAGIPGGTAATSRSDRDIFNLFGVYKRDKITVQAEYLTGESQLRGATTSREIKGYYATLGYLFTPKIEGVFRYDYLDTNRDFNGDADVRDLILGLNYYIKGNNAKIQANLLRRNGAPGGGTGAAAFTPPADLRNDRTELRVQGQVAF